jgi:hypothetical protein
MGIEPMVRVLQFLTVLTSGVKPPASPKFHALKLFLLPVLPNFRSKFSFSLWQSCLKTPRK